MKKVLIVDDDPAMAELISEFCQQAGYETRVLTSSQQTLDVVQEWQPNLITLDIEMPGIDGIEVLRQLQSRPETSRIPVVIISVLAKGIAEEGLLKGAQTVFEKPLKFEKLLSRLQQIMSASHQKKNKPDIETIKRLP